jgi:hypothetical protein
MGVVQHLTDGHTRRCPRCREALMFTERYPVLTIGMALTRSRSDVGHIRYERAWVCRNGSCDYRELVGDA